MGHKTYPVEQSPLFKLSSRKRLAQSIFKVELPFLERLAHGHSNYRVFTKHTGGKERVIEQPCPTLEALHRRLFVVLRQLETPDYMHSGVVGRSFVSNAMVHIGEVPLVSLDIRKFYACVNGGMVYRFFASTMQCSPDVAGLLTRLCTYDNHLPKGSCVSQILAFRAAKPLFDELHELAVEADVRESYYVDDLTWSGINATGNFLWKAKQVVHRHGLRYHKGRCFAAQERRVVTGVMLDGSKAKIQPCKELEIWKTLHASHQLSPTDRAIVLESLIGSLTAASHIEPRFANRIPSIRRLLQETSDR